MISRSVPSPMTTLFSCALIHLPQSRTFTIPKAAFEFSALDAAPEGRTNAFRISVVQAVKKEDGAINARWTGDIVMNSEDRIEWLEVLP